MKIQVIVAVLATIMLFPVLATAGNVVLIGNPSVRESVLTKQDIKKIYLGKKRVWNDGTKVVFAINTDKDLFKLFLKKYVGKSPSQYDNFWRTKVFSGKRSSPLMLDGNQKIINFVSETKGAIGYVSDDSKLDNTKTFKVISGGK